MYNGKDLKTQSLDSLKIEKSVNFDVIIAKEKLKLLPRDSVTIKGDNFCVANLRKNRYVIYASEKKLSSYHRFIENIFDYDEDILCKV